MKAMNDYVICSEASEQSGQIEMPNSPAESVKQGSVISTTERAEDAILENLPEDTKLEDVTVYFRAAEALMFPEEDKIAVPMKALIAVKVKEQTG